ncbi:MAG: hypothetical protein ACXW6R_21625 [Candidatus Binatia bacterium]
MDEKSDKLLEWALLALSRQDSGSAAALYQQYADQVRGTNPDLAHFYEHLLSSTLPVASPLRLEDMTGDGHPTVTAIDRLLEASLTSLRANDLATFSASIMDVLYLYTTRLQHKVIEMRHSGNAAPLWRIVDLIEIDEKIAYCLARFREIAERREGNGQ